MAADNSEAEQKRRVKRHWPPLSILAGGIAIGFAVSVVVVLVALVVFLRDPTPVLTKSDLDAAILRWEQRGPAGYNLDVVVGGRQPGEIHVEVRDGQVTAMTRDGITPRRRDTWEYWNVPMQLETIQHEMESAKEPAVGFGAPAGSTVAMRARFDAELGYPVKYRRRVLGTPLAVEWEIVHFEIVP